MFVIMKFMLYSLLRICVCTNSILLYISKVINRWRWFWEWILDYRFFQECLNYILILLEGINVFWFHILTHFIGLVVLYFYCMGGAPIILVSRIWWYETYYFIWFYMKEILKDYSNAVNSFNSTLLLINVYSMNYMKWIVEDLREVKYAVTWPKNDLIVGV